MALVAMLGKGAGHHLHALSHNLDPRPVEVGRRRRSVGSQQALGRGRHHRDDLVVMLQGIVDRVMRRLRSGGRVGRTVVLRLRFDDFSRATRSRTLQWPTSASEPALEAAVALFDDAWPTIDNRGLTLIGMSIANLSEDTSVQLSLPFDRDHAEVVVRGRRSSHARQRHDALDHTLDEIHDRFGTSVVTRASLLGRDGGIEVPKLPD